MLVRKSKCESWQREIGFEGLDNISVIFFDAERVNIFEKFTRVCRKEFLFFIFELQK